MKLGPRVIKTGIAVTLALYVCSIFNLESAMLAGVAAIFYDSTIDLPNMEACLESSANKYLRCHYRSYCFAFSWQ